VILNAYHTEKRLKSTDADGIYVIELLTFIGEAHFQYPSSLRFLHNVEMASLNYQGPLPWRDISAFRSSGLNSKINMSLFKPFRPVGLAGSVETIIGGRRKGNRCLDRFSSQKYFLMLFQMQSVGVTPIPGSWYCEVWLSDLTLPLPLDSKVI